MPYVPTGIAYPFVDIGCGAGEFVLFLKKNEINAIGVDREINEVERGLMKGIDVISADGLSFLKKSNEPLAGISMIEVIEHQPQEDIFEIVQLAYDRIVSGGIILIESINARHPYFIQGFYSDFTHFRPVTDAFLTFLLQWAGFKDVKLIFTVPAPVSFISPQDLSRIYWCYALIGKKP
jgi:O-antigen chain-terminating methyltransferase